MNKTRKICNKINCDGSSTYTEGLDDITPLVENPELIKKKVRQKDIEISLDKHQWRDV